MKNKILKVLTILGMALLLTACSASDKPAESTDIALKEIKELVGGEKQTASQAVKRLTELMNALDQRGISTHFSKFRIHSTLNNAKHRLVFTGMYI